MYPLVTGEARDIEVVDNCRRDTRLEGKHEREILRPFLGGSVLSYARQTGKVQKFAVSKFLLHFHQKAIIASRQDESIVMANQSPNNIIATSMICDAQRSKSGHGDDDPTAFARITPTKPCVPFKRWMPARCYQEQPQMPAN